MEYFELYHAPKGSPKKWSIRLPSSSGRGRTVSFGARGYRDYTQHGDPVRRKNYLNRHQGDRIDDPYAAGFWSWHVLWGNSTDLDTNLASAIRRAKRILKQRGIL